MITLLQQWHDKEVLRLIEEPFIQEIGATPFADLNNSQMDQIYKAGPIRSFAIIEVAKQAEPPNTTVIAAISGMATERAMVEQGEIETIQSLSGRKFRKAASNLPAHESRFNLYSRLSRTANRALGLLATSQA